ncbi:hypothetical protein Chor_015375 [Crotalus horridus]
MGGASAESDPRLEGASSGSMSRFRVSKFRHVEAKVARKEAWIGDLQSSCPSGNPRIKANSLWIAFSTDLAGVLGTVPLESPKGIKTVVSHLHCHSDVVTDFDFSPFDQQLLATASADKAVKVWRLLEANQDLSASPHVMLGPHGSQVEVLLFHPTADGVLASAAGKAVKIWDVEQQQILIELEPHLNQVQSLAWKPDGSLLGTSCRDKRLHIFDPRAKPVACQTVLAHAGGKEARLLWVNAEGFFLSVGSNQMMEREVCLWDSRRLNSSLASVTLDASPREELTAALRPRTTSSRELPLCPRSLSVAGLLCPQPFSASSLLSSSQGNSGNGGSFREEHISSAGALGEADPVAQETWELDLALAGEAKPELSLISLGGCSWQPL